MKRLVPFLVLLLLTGCTSYEARVERGRSLAGVQRYFVLTNASDNHGLAEQIAAALKARGCEAATGPSTMLPDDTQAIASYQDHWAWDFGDHLVYLQVTVRDRLTGQVNATATFTAKVPTRKPPAEIVDELIGQLLPRKS